MTTTQLAPLRTRAKRLLRDYMKAEGEARTPIARALAETFVDVRAETFDSDGNPDWRGKTYAYRVWIRDLFADVNLRDEDARRTQAAIRYHLSSVLRERLTDEELDDLGMMHETARDRSHKRRQERIALVNALEARDGGGGVLVGLTAVAGILDRIDLSALSDLDESDLVLARAKVKEIAREIARAKRALA